jgi:hypothetical protein
MPHSGRMNGNKKGSKKHSLPYAAEVKYVHPRVDSAPSAVEVDVPEQLLDVEVAVETIEEAIDLYLDAHRRKFSGKHGAPRKAQRLGRFLRYLTAKGQSTKLSTAKLLVTLDRILVEIVKAEIIVAVIVQLRLRMTVCTIMYMG